MAHNSYSGFRNRSGFLGKPQLIAEERLRFLQLLSLLITAAFDEVEKDFLSGLSLPLYCKTDRTVLSRTIVEFVLCLNKIKKLPAALFREQFILRGT